MTIYSSNVYTVQLVCGRRFLLQLGGMLVYLLFNAYKPDTVEMTPYAPLSCLSCHRNYELNKHRYTDSQSSQHLFVLSDLCFVLLHYFPYLENIFCTSLSIPVSKVTFDLSGRNTELQLGVSTRSHAMEGDFLGSTSTSCGYLLKLGSIAMKEGMRPVTKWSGFSKSSFFYLIQATLSSAPKYQKDVPLFLFFYLSYSHPCLY